MICCIFVTISFTIRLFCRLEYSMFCEYCQEEYTIKKSYIAKNCGCDDDFRFLSFDFWYLDVFKIYPEFI